MPHLAIVATVLLPTACAWSAASTSVMPRMRTTQSSSSLRMMADEDGGGLSDLFAQSLKQQKKEDDAKKKEEKGKIRLGPNLDLANRPQNFFRGLAERDERLEREGLPDGVERATLVSDYERNLWIIGLSLIAAVVAAKFGYSAYETNAYQAAVDNDNNQLVRCLDMAFSFSEKNICRLKY